MIKIFLITMISICLITIIINLYIVIQTKNQIKTTEFFGNKKVDCIIVLGAGIRGNNPSPMLEDRLLTSIDLYKKGVSNKIIVSGDHGRENYDEVNVMKNYLIQNGIPSEDIFMDHAGFSTYDTIYRAKHIFMAKKVVVVTQKYHLYRTLHISNELDIEAYGVSANKRPYGNQLTRDIREIVARVKDFFKSLINITFIICLLIYLLVLVLYRL